VKADRPVVVIGAGPAGLTAAYEVAKLGQPVVVFEQDDCVGGLARTIDYKGFRFDIGGHRFFTKVPMVADMWRAMLGPDLLTRPRLSRIYYRGRFFHYPLKPIDALSGLGIGTSLAVLMSYCRVSAFPIEPEASFADWVSNRFGRRMYRIFFRTYTEKVWGLSGDRLRADWAAQRIAGLSLGTAILNSLYGGRRGTDALTKTLIDRFEYPRLGPGMMWTAFRDHVERLGGRIELGCRLARLLHDGTRVHSLAIERAGLMFQQPASHVISSIPLGHLVRSLTPAPSADVLSVTDQLRHRAFVTVALIVDQPHVFSDNWIYIHDEAVKVGRIQNYKNWSPHMVPDDSRTGLGLEYFCDEGDALWSLSTADLIELAKRELSALGLVRPEKVVDGTVVRVRHAYPVYDEGFAHGIDVARRSLAPLTNLQTIGRNGMHRYNNQDHSMLTAILAVRNLFGERHDLWSVNTEQSYHEERQPQYESVGFSPGDTESVSISG
jgi:protoporphyrinogen oxidase